MNHLIRASKKRFFKSISSTRSTFESRGSKNEFIFGENNNYCQIGNAYLEFDITVRKNDTTNFHNEDHIRLLKKSFAFCSKEAQLSTTIGSDIEHNKFLGFVGKYLLL